MNKATRFYKALIRLFLFALILLSLFLLWQRETVLYLIQQGIGQASVIFESKSIESLKNQNYFTAEQVRKLALIEEVKRFTVDSLGFRNSKAYTTYFESHNKPILYVLTACKKTSLSPYAWRFPLLGFQNYKGFFELKRAHEELDRLDTNIYDVQLSEVSAWSTLGFLNDPVLSSMMKLPDYSLIELIIHELTHGEIFIASNTTFNENVANLIGINGARYFMRSKGEKMRLELNNYEEYLQDRKVFRSFAIEAYKELQKLYETLENQPLDSILKMREVFFENFKSEILFLPLSDGSRYFKLAAKERAIDNCFFISYAMYNQDFEEIEGRLQNDFDGNLNTYIETVKKENRLYGFLRN